MEPMKNEDWRNVFHSLFTVGKDELALKMMIEMACEDEFPVATLILWAFEEGKLLGQ